MRCFLLLGALGVAVTAAPQGYEYKKPATGFQSQPSQIILPCTHHLNDAASALIQSQSTARIVNHQKHYSADHNFATAASGYSGQAHQTNADKSSFNQGATQTLQSGHGYFENGGNFVAQIPPHIQAQPFNSENVKGGQQLAPLYNQGFNYNQGVLSHGSQHGVYQHSFAAINSQPQNVVRPPVYPLPTSDRPISSGLVGNLAATRPLQLSAGGNANYENEYAGSSDHFEHASSHSASSTSAQNALHATNGGSFFNLGNAELSQIPSSGAVDVLNGQLGHVIRETFANAPLDPSVEKHIYVHVPPEDLEESYHQQHVAQNHLTAPAQKHYKIIFIKAPSAPAPNYGQLTALAPQTEEKTLVYVLVKKPDEPSLEQIQQIQQSSYKSSKPEVYFIKYKTRKENEPVPYSGNSANPTESFKQQQQPQHINDVTNDAIDIRSGGDNTPLSTSSSSSNTGAISEVPKHELYGVPLN